MKKLKTAYVFLAEGFEEMEAVAPIDIMRRAGIRVVTVGLGGRLVQGAHGICLQADVDGEGFVLPEDAGLVMLPGGGLGTENLAKSDMVSEVLRTAAERGIFIAAICAAPNVLNGAGLLDGKRATAFPTSQKNLTQSVVTGAAVEVDGNIITGRAAGVALQFGGALVRALLGEEAARRVIDSLYPEINS